MFEAVVSVIDSIYWEKELFDEEWDLLLLGCICAYIWFCVPGQVMSQVTYTRMLISSAMIFSLWNLSIVFLQVEIGSIILSVIV